MQSTVVTPVQIMIDWQRADLLMGQVQAGDDAAAEALVQLTGGWLRMSLLAYLNDPTLADDLLQEVYIQLFEHPKDYQTGTHFGAFLKTRARYAALSAIRSQQRRSVAVHRYAHTLRVELADDLHDRVERDHDRIAQLRVCRERLSESAQDLIRLRYEESAPVQTISERLGRTPDWVRSTLHRIRLELARCLQRTAGSGA